MKARDRGEDQLINELTEMRRRVGELEATAAKLRETEKALRESEERFRLLYENAPLGYQSLDENGYFLEVNQAWLDTLGYSREEVLGKWFGDFLALGYRDHFKINFPRFKAAGEIHWVEFEMIRKDGSQIAVAFDGQIGRDEQGRFKQTHCILHDITQIKGSEEAIKASELRYRRLFESAQDGILILDFDTGQILDVNPYLTDMLGYSHGESLGKCLWEVSPFKDSDLNKEAFEELQQDGYVRYEDLPLETRDGRAVDVEFVSNSYPVDGRTFIQCNIRDITRRKQSESDLKEQVSFMESLVEAIPAPVFFKDTDHVYLGCNESFAEFMGLPKEKIIKKSVLDVAPKELVENFRKQDETLFKNPGLQIYETSVEAINGSMRNVIIHKATFTNAFGEVAGLIGVILDITDRKEVDEALRESEAKYRAIFLGASEGILVADPLTAKFKYANPAICNMLGYTEAELKGLTVSDIHPKEKLEYVGSEFQAIARREKSRAENIPCLRKDGTVFYANVGGASITIDGFPCTVGFFSDITERKRVEESLQNSEERLRLTLEATRIGIWDWDLKTDDWYASPTYYAMLGYEPRTGLADRREWLERVHPDDRARVNEKIQDVLAKDFKEYRYEARLRHADGAYRWQHVQGVSIKRDEDGKVTRMLGIRMDITDRKRAEQSLREAGAFLETLLNAIPAPVFYKDVDGRYLGFNKSFEEFYGTTRQELVGKSVFDIAPRELAEVYHAKDLEALRNPGVQVYGSQVQDSHGAVHDVLLHKATFLDPQGNVLGLIGVILDITERKRAEEALARANQEWERTFDAISDAVMVLDDRHKIVRANKAMADALRMTESELIGKHCFQLVHGENEPPVFCPHSQLLTDGREHSAEVVEPILGGVYDVRVSPLVGQNGQVIGSVHVIRDITGQKSLQRQLLQAQKMEALGTLAGGIAHDFNNLLTVVLGFSELLLIGKDERDPSYADLQKIHQAARSGADLVQRILAFSRKTEINPRPLNLNREIVQVKKLLDRTIPKMIEIGLLLSDELAMAHADPVQIEQILMNLAVNAKDAMPDGGKLTIETKNVALDEEYCRIHLGSKAGDYVLISVSDTGHGMDKETLKHIFEPFYTTKGIGRGTGLGLAMVYGIVKQHDGYITCYSELRMGTTFRIYLPVIAVGAKSETPEDKPTLPRGTERILLVDDDDFVRELGKRILERSGYTVLTAAKGKEALDLYSKERDKISLVILDLIMPEMGGKECLEGLLKIDARVKVLIASGYAAEGQTKDAIETGARGFVGKPYDMKQMLQATRDVLDSD